MQRRETRRWKTAGSLIALAGGMLLSLPVGAMAETDLSIDDFMEIVGTYSVNNDIPGYREYCDQFDAVWPEETVSIGAADYVRYEDSEDAKAKPEIYSDYKGKDGDSVLISETGMIEYEFEVEEEGFYQMNLSYFPIEGKASEIQRAVFLDGALPYEEMADLELSRIWSDDITSMSEDENGILVQDWEVDNQGNHLKPGMEEVPEWITTALYDSNGYVTDALSVYLTPGEHSIALLSLREPLLLNEITFTPAEEIKTYEEVKAQWDEEGAQETSGVSIRIEAENASRTSSQMLYPQQDQSSPSVYPVSTSALLNNSIGGNSWKLTGQWIEWEFEVPQDGYYNISMYAKQNFMRGIYVSRKIMIDGRVPFEEMEDYGFSYAQSWRLDMLSDEEDNPYEFYLTEGTHAIRMQVVLGEFSDIIGDVQESVTKLNAIYRSVIRITGVSPDVYRDYQLSTSVPGLEEDLKDAREQLGGALARLREVAGSGSDKETVLVTMVDQLDELIADQDRFPEVIGSFRINVRATGNWITQVVAQPLQLDRIYVTSADTDVKIEKNGFLDNAAFEVSRLYYSFIIDYNQVGNVADDEDTTAITLWIGTGRDQANVIKSLIDETFTPETGISVNVQLVDMNTLLRATLVNEGPDVAIQVANTNGIAGAVLNTGNDTPVNYGLRNAVLDLTQFEDFEEVASRFNESALTAFSFDGATYALPETQTFLMMFYRKDILAEIGLEIPQTWDDVKVAMNVLSKNQMEFGMLPSEQVFAMLLYQAGGEYYTEDATASALDSDIAVNAFKEYCEYYTDYKLDKETSVEERFRTGECPLIIADYTVYNNLEVSAPDIKGLWGFTMVPGTEKEDGTIDRTVGCTGLASLIMSATDEPDASWEFLKWWSSAETQIAYDREMESLMGSSARVATANLEAFESLPWPVEDFRALQEQFTWVKGIPQVPGGYYSWRNVNNAFYTVTTKTDIASPREELMDKVIYINDEISFKRDEFGLPLAGDAATEE
ncbi:MAG: extracellular solute-binding protein [Lachnospiraceae bacterium]|nr:extracellular solute-binding protein [Lachnospiraceae bacterium]